MILLRERYRWKTEDSKTDVKFSFVCPGEVTGIRILFSFDPDALEDPEACRPMIEKAIRQYYDNRPLEWDRIRPESIGPLKNQITISLSKDGEYLEMPIAGRKTRCMKFQRQRLLPDLSRLVVWREAGKA